MALTLIGSATANAATITIPGAYKAGDIILIFAYKSSVTAPTQPGSWNNLSNGSSGATSYRLSYKVAVGASDTSGTWTGASMLACLVYRGVATDKLFAGTPAVATGTSATVSYPALTLREPNVATLACFAGISTTTSTLETPPTGLTFRSGLVGTSYEVAAFDSNGVYGNQWSAKTTSVGVSAEYRTAIVELYPEQLNLENYKSFKVPSGMSASEKIR